MGRITLLSVLKIRLFGSQTPKYVQILAEHCNIRERKNDSLLSDAAAAAAESLQSCPTLCDPIDGSPPGTPVPGILQAKNTGVGCHFLLQCMKAKSESEVAQSCPTLSDPMDCSPPGSSVHGIFLARGREGLPLPSPT